MTPAEIIRLSRRRLLALIGAAGVALRLPVPAYYGFQGAAGLDLSRYSAEEREIIEVIYGARPETMTEDRIAWTLAQARAFGDL
jgi:hypothetical protein